MEPTTEETPVHPVKKFVNRHLFAIGFTTSAVTCLVLNRIAIKQHDDFLREHDLYDEFYNPEEE